MFDPENVAPEPRNHGYVLGASVVIAAVAVAVIVGWISDITLLKTVVPGFPEMKPNTAASFLLAAAAIYCISCKGNSPRYSLASVAFAAVMLLIGGLTLVEYVAAVDLGLDNLLFTVPDAALSPYPGRMSPHTAFNFIVLATSLMSLAGGRRLRKLSEFLSLFLSVTTLASVLGFLYSAEILYDVSTYVAMALHTAALFIICSVAMLAANPDSEIGNLVTSDSQGGVSIRRLVPAVVLVPLGIDWLRLEGQELGLFDQRLGSALLQFSRIVIMCWIMLLFSRATQRIDVRRSALEHDLRVNEKRYHDLFEYSQGMVCIHDLKGVLKTVNPAVLQTLGYELDEVVGRNLVDFIPEERRERTITFFRKLEFEGLADGLMVVNSRSGKQLTWRYHSVLITEDGEEPYAIGHAQDVTELIHAQEQLRALSLTDDLTGLYNRRGFLTMAEQQIKLERHKRTARGLTLMFADMDGLKRINDVYGHDAGSDALVEMANAISSSLRTADLVARWGGDEFVILAIGSEDEYAAAIAERIQQRIREYNAASGKPYDVACSIGLAELPLDGTKTLESVIADADNAMYEEKRRRKATVAGLIPPAPVVSDAMGDRL